MADNVVAQDLERTWEQLRDGFGDAYASREMSKDTYLGLYQHVYSYCSRRPLGHENAQANNPALGSYRVHGEGLYHRLRDLIQTHLQEAVLQGSTDKNGEDLINFYLEQWSTFTFGSKVIDGICAYFNRHWVIRENEEGRQSCQIYQLAMNIWKHTVFEALRSPMATFTLKLIQDHRNGLAVNASLIKNLTESFAELGKDWDTKWRMTQSSLNRTEDNDDDGLTIYREGFEDGLITETVDYYAKESTDFFLANGSVSDYMKKAEQRLNEEVDRVRLYLHPSTLPRLIKSCESELIERQLPILMDTFPGFLRAERTEDMGRLYRLVSRVTHAFTDMTALLETHISNEGAQALTINQQQGIRDPSEYVNTVLNVYRKFSELVSTAFNREPVFVTALDRGCEAFINKRAASTNEQFYTAAMMLSKYCDGLLRKGGRNHEDHELEELLSQALIIFRFIVDKDVFQKCYTHLLAARLVGELSSSDDAEVSMITKLKAACGFEYTSKMHRMYLDAGLSRETNGGFREWMISGRDKVEPLKVDFSAMILQSGSWPFRQDQCAGFVLPQELEPCVTQFSLFYATKHEGRKLNWLYARSHGEIVANCLGDRKYTFAIFTYGIAVLLQYNSGVSYTVQELMDATQLSEDVLNQVVQIFIKANILKSDDGLDSLSPTSVVYLYKDYKNKRLKVSLMTPLKTEVQKDDDQTEVAIEKERALEVKCAIVRVMKARKELGHQLLVSEVVTQLQGRFSPTVSLINKSIDELITAEYLRRKEGEPNNVFQYIS